MQINNHIPSQICNGNYTLCFYIVLKSNINSFYAIIRLVSRQIDCNHQSLSAGVK